MNISGVVNNLVVTRTLFNCCENLQGFSKVFTMDMTMETQLQEDGSLGPCLG